MGVRLIAFALVAFLAAVPPSLRPSPTPFGTISCGGVPYAPVTGTEAIRNGGFENGLQDWTASGVVSPAITTAVVHSGSEAAFVRITGIEAPPVGAYQSLGRGPSVFAYVQWIYVVSYEGRVGFSSDLLRNWNPSTGSADIITSVLLNGGRVYFVSWYPGTGGGSTQAIPIGVSTGTWNELSVIADAGRGVQCLFLNGTLLATATVDPAHTFLPDVVTFGGRAAIPEAPANGAASYDDFSLVELQVAASNPCPSSQGYWKNHPGTWPVDSLVLGTESYSKDELLGFLRTPARGDASVILGHQLIAARLNIARGADPAPIASALSDADALLTGRLPLSISPAETLGHQMTAVASRLDTYNNGSLSPGCPP